MRVYVVFFMISLCLGDAAVARLASRVSEDSPSLNSKHRSRTGHNISAPSPSSGKEQQSLAIGNRGQIKTSSGQKGQNQGQATSTAYDREDFTISVDVGLALQEDHSLENPVSVGLSDSGGDKTGGQSTYSTPLSFSAQAISSAALGRAKAADALKKKLQAENKKTLHLQDVSGEASQNDHRQDIINKLVEASQDIEK